MTISEKIKDAVAKWKKLIEALRELFDAIVATFVMIGDIAMEVRFFILSRIRVYKSKLRKAYRRKRKGRW